MIEKQRQSATIASAPSASARRRPSVSAFLDKMKPPFAKSGKEESNTTSPPAPVKEKTSSEKEEEDSPAERARKEEALKRFRMGQDRSSKPRMSTTKSPSPPSRTVRAASSTVNNRSPEYRSPAVSHSPEHRERRSIRPEERRSIRPEEHGRTGTLGINLFGSDQTRLSRHHNTDDPRRSTVVAAHRSSASMSPSRIAAAVPKNDRTTVHATIRPAAAEQHKSTRVLDKIAARARESNARNPDASRASKSHMHEGVGGRQVCVSKNKC